MSQQSFKVHFLANKLFLKKQKYDINVDDLYQGLANVTSAALVKYLLLVLFSIQF